MRIIVLSDSHGDTQALLSAVAVTGPDMIMHLGDYASDCDVLMRSFPQIPIHVVKGNCDLLSSKPLIDDVFCGKTHIYMCHGHTFGVKTGLSSLIRAGEENRADIVLFGHTHEPYYDLVQNMHVINPGTIGYARKTYGVLELRGGEINYENRSTFI